MVGSVVGALGVYGVPLSWAMEPRGRTTASRSTRRGKTKVRAMNAEMQLACGGGHFKRITH